MKNKLSLLALLIVILASCTKNSHPDYYGTVRPDHPSDELVINASVEPQYLDPAKISDSTSRILASSMFIRMVQAHPQTGVPTPELAKSWEVSKDGREYTFHLREDAVWSDGQPITAHDVEYSWKRIADPKTGSTYIQMADVFEGSRAFRERAIEVVSYSSEYKYDLGKLKKKIEEIAKVKEIFLDQKTGKILIFIASDDPAKKEELRNELKNRLSNGLVGHMAEARIVGSDNVQVKAKDDHTLWVRLSKPVPYFLGLISYMVFAPVPKHLIEKMKAEGKEDLWVRPENIVVSGAFILVEEQFKQYKIYKKNPKYYNASKVRLNKVKALLIEDYQASINAYKTGQHDWTAETSIPSNMLGELEKFKDFHFDPQLATYFYFFNTTKKPFDNIKVRQAMNLAIDRKAIVDSVVRQKQKPSRDLVPDGIFGYEGPRSSIYDPELAKKLLAEAGFPGGKGFPKVMLKYNTSDNHKKIAEAAQAMWKTVLGIHVDIANMEWRSLLEDQNQGKFDMVRYAWTADYMDPHTFLSVMMSESENNKAKWKNKKYDELILLSDNTQDQKKRFEYFREAEKILAEDAPIIPFYFYTRTYLKKPYIKGFWPQFQDQHEWKYIWIDDRWSKGVPENVDVGSDEPWVD